MSKPHGQSPVASSGELLERGVTALEQIAAALGSLAAEHGYVDPPDIPRADLCDQMRRMIKWPDEPPLTIPDDWNP